MITMLSEIIWIICTGCIAFASSQLPHIPSITYVDRNWYVRSNDPNGTVVTRVHSERTNNHPVTYGLQTSDPPLPFTIDPSTGVVTVNDTLSDKENRTYGLWVTSYDGGILQRTEVVASVTDKSGQRTKIFPPSLSLPYFPGIRDVNYHPEISTDILTKKPTIVTTTQGYIETIPDSTVTTPASQRPEVITEDTAVNEDKKDNKSIIIEENKLDNVSMTVIPLVAICGLVVIVAAVIFFVWKRNTSPRSSKKDDMSHVGRLTVNMPNCADVVKTVLKRNKKRRNLLFHSKDSNGIVLRDAGANLWDRPRAYSNRYEGWDNNHLQISDETSVVEKVEPRDEWEFPRHRIRIFNIVGEGAFGQVWRAQAIDIDGKKGEATVAVKTLKENASEKEKADLLQELIVMKNLGPHPNVVRLIGCCTEKEPTLVIMEFVSLGKLQQFLRDSRAERHYRNTHGGSQFLTSRDLTHFAFQVARGMDFLSSKGIIHRDLAARNVLISEERTCKVADFGFARDVGGAHVYERKSDGRLPIRWMAPESLYDDIFSVKSDIWSFGVLLWEIVTLGSTPYPGLSAGDVMKKVRDGHRLEKPEHCRRELYNIMYYCWEAEPTNRPDFKEVVSMLERLLCTETDYIELERFPDHSYYNVQNLEGEKL